MRYVIETFFDLKEGQEPLTPDEECSLQHWVQGTLDNGAYDSECGFPNNVEMGYTGGITSRRD